jgi:NAD+ synthetase
MLKIALAQINTTVGDFDGNLSKVLARIEAAGEVDLIAFPELSLTGYPPKDLLLDPALIDAQDEAVSRLLDFTRGRQAHIVIGAATRNTGAGKPLHNSLLVIRNGNILRSYHKQLLPTYDVFDERRYFEPVHYEPLLLDINGHRVGFLVCEDGWNYGGHDYPADPVSDYRSAGATLLVSINASPAYLGKAALREKTFIEAHIPIAYVNQVGGNDDLVFDGGSFFASNGQLRARAALFAEDLLIGTYDKGGFADGIVAPLPGEEKQLFSILSLGLRDYLAKTGFETVVVGSSGGIDSALVLAISALTLSPDRVTAVTMPSRYSSAGSVSDSDALCRNLGVKMYRYAIADLAATYEDGFADAFGESLKGLAAENLQARIRGTILMEYSNASGALLVSTGNKSEMSVGYCTLYGDTNGGIGLLGDLFKTDVYRLAAWINDTFGNPIPAAIINKAPSAELAPDQVDQDSLPPYDVLDDLLKELLEGAPRRVEDQAIRDRVQKMLDRAEFKRKQAPPIIKARPRSFGAGRQFPIARK